MPIDFDNLYRSKGIVFHPDPAYEAEMERFMQRPQPHVLTSADEPRFSFGLPRKHSAFEEIKAYEECIARGGRPG